MHIHTHTYGKWSILLIVSPECFPNRQNGMSHFYLDWMSNLLWKGVTKSDVTYKGTCLLALSKTAWVRKIFNQLAQQWTLNLWWSEPASNLCNRCLVPSSSASCSSCLVGFLNSKKKGWLAHSAAPFHLQSIVQVNRQCPWSKQSFLTEAGPVPFQHQLFFGL